MNILLNNTQGGPFSMENLLKILKINLLSLIAFPIFLCTIICKLFATTWEKINIILGMLSLTIEIVVLFSILDEIRDDAESMLVLGSMILFSVFYFGVILLIMYLIFRYFKYILIRIYRNIQNFTEQLYTAFYHIFILLFQKCKNNYDYLQFVSSKTPLILCLCYTILRFIKWMSIKIFSLSFILSIATSLVMIIGSIAIWNHNVFNTFGINLIQFIFHFDTFSIVRDIMTYILLLSTILIVLLSLGNEWYELSLELTMNREDFDNLKHEQSQEETSSNNFDPTLFAGCNSKESLTKRYKNLMKTFHPDNADGDTEMAQKIKETYERLLEKYT